MRSTRRSKPTVDRQMGVRSKSLIATSSIEQHGYEGRPKSRRPLWTLPIPDGAIGDLRFRKAVRGVKGPDRRRKHLNHLPLPLVGPAAESPSRQLTALLVLRPSVAYSASLTCEDVLS